MTYEKRPWGGYEVLRVDGSVLVKKIYVNPKSKLSLQSHMHRSEDWFYVQGDGLVTLDDKLLSFPEIEYVHIPKRAVHRVENIHNAPLVFYEVQSGPILSEDDIVRYEDDYGRCS